MQLSVSNLNYFPHPTWTWNCNAMIIWIMHDYMHDEIKPESFLGLWVSHTDYVPQQCVSASLLVLAMKKNLHRVAEVYIFMRSQKFYK